MSGYLKALDDWVEEVFGLKPASFQHPAKPPAAPAGDKTPGQKPQAGMAPDKQPSTADLGGLSSHYESGGRGSNAVGTDSTGGWSYGKYQIATQTGTMKKFLAYLKTANPDIYKKLDDAGGNEGATDHTDAFAKAWDAAAKTDGFAGLEHGFIANTHYDPQAEKLSTKGLDVGKRDKAVRDVTWSVSVQHGGGANVIVNALNKRVAEEEAKDKASGATRTRPQIIDGISDEQLIDDIYDERSATVEKGGKTVMKYFSNSTEAEQKAVCARFVAERAAAKKELDADRKAAQPQAPAHS